MKKHLIINVDDNDFYYVILEVNQNLIDALLLVRKQQEVTKALLIIHKATNLLINPIGLKTSKVKNNEDVYAILIDRLDNLDWEEEEVPYHIFDSRIVFDEKVPYSLCEEEGQREFNIAYSEQGYLTFGWEKSMTAHVGLTSLLSDLAEVRNEETRQTILPLNNGNNRNINPDE